MTIKIELHFTLDIN